VLFWASRVAFSSAFGIQRSSHLAIYLVTGAAGFIGRSIAAELLRRGQAVRGIDNFLTGKRANLRGLEGMEFVEGDLVDPAFCAKACGGVEIVFHQAALASIPRSIADPVATHVNCVQATLNLLVAARAAGVRRVLYAGSSSVYGPAAILPSREDMLPNPLTPYAAAKLAGEHYLRAFAGVYGLEAVVLRYFNVFGPCQDPSSRYSGVLAVLCRQMLAGEQPTVFGDGEQSRDFTYIDNVVDANLLASSAPSERVSGQTMNIAAGCSFKLNEIVEILRELTGYSGAVAYRTPRPGDNRASLADIRLAERVIGYRPQVSFRAGLARTVQWYREHVLDECMSLAGR
jgi:UDP-glucose 4-epimerase